KKANFIPVQPFDTENGERCPKQISDEKHDLKKGAVKKMLASFFEIKLGFQNLFKRIEYNK
ncbi:MAG TPA: hypothetical protein VLQ91_18270, partial [Draconibacterium sp.]|nr:hypothetical protein [Draconibacterium sp.]